MTVVPRKSKERLAVSRDADALPRNALLGFRKERLAVSLLCLRAEAEGRLAIAALVAIIALLFTAKWLGFL
jgi:hypothetical protein